MKSLTQFITEELDTDNLFWLLDKWFERNEQQAQEFVELVVKCKQDGDKVNIDNLKTYIKGTQLESNLMEFCNFIDNDIEPQQTKNYLYSLKQIIEMVIGKKENNKYLKK
jgi:hypothetical protein